MPDYATRSTILVVDDQPANIMVLGEALKSDYQIKMATSGIKAIDIALSEDPPDLILLDIIMPHMDGYEVCKELKKDLKTQKIPIIFITAKDQEEDETKGLNYGAVDYITKPFSTPIVKARVKTHIELKRHRDLLEDLSTLDGLTGIPNRRKFDEYLKTEWERAVRGSYPLSLIMIDLKKVATKLRMTAKRAGDFVARYGGEEFVSILPNTTAKRASAFAELLRSNIETLNISHKFSFIDNKITISLGVAAIAPAMGASSDILIQTADKALYEAKSNGRNRYECADI